ncbi:MULTISPECIES: hypothetical protein [Streptomyces]|uniref:hypothetical protein n=1 Tax=Streptomyces TaxID=1883 RepID=UPI000F4ED7F8|nr:MULTISPECIES: hypothetical protein [Streptomyces]
MPGALRRPARPAAAAAAAELLHPIEERERNRSTTRTFAGIANAAGPGRGQPEQWGPELPGRQFAQRVGVSRRPRNGRPRGRQGVVGERLGFRHFSGQR